MKKIRKPSRILMMHEGRAIYLYPLDVGLAEVKRVRDRLNKAIAYLEQQKRETKNER